ncbi:MAG: RNA polymerase sigma-54 factor [Planctomycetota bacterium]|nr:MAG: RNA polymerase sigma-54 factor [Planctomycetota bacterium]
MNLGLQQGLRTDLQLRLSPQILQRIEVLQLPALDLLELVEQELQANEALEAEREEPAESTEADADTESDSEVDDFDPDEYADDEWRPSSNTEAASRTDVLEATAEAEESLADALARQLDVLELEPRQRAICHAILDALNDRGWLDLPLDDLELTLDPPASDEEREAALHVVQRLDPPGIGCRDLEECLLLQLDPEQADYQFLATLVLNHLDDIARNRIPRICRDTEREVDDVLAAIDLISHLDPVPGRRYGRSDVPVVRPDVVVHRVGDDYEIHLENDWLPTLSVSRSYLEMARDRRVDSELRKHLRSKIEGAQSLIEAVEQRKHTLFRVANELVTRQHAFLDDGPAKLRPLRMQEVADALGVHVSTISRAISGKSIQTPRGIFPLKTFFTGEVASKPGAADSETSSRASVQDLIRRIVDAEDKRAPLSDEAIVRLLADEHELEIARRTVTKYRKALGLGSSRARREYGST